MTVRYFVGCLAMSALLPCAALAAPSGVPSAGNSTVPGHLLSSPDGLFVSQVIVRDFASNPIANSMVVLDFSGCASFHPCPDACANCTTSLGAKTVSKLTNAAGVASFDLRVGGSGCPNPPAVRIFADGVPLGAVNFSSLDINGDFTVTMGDLATLRYVLIPAQDLNGDFNGDLVVNEYDEGIALANLGATCDPATPARRHTWGQLKTVYR